MTDAVDVVDEGDAGGEVDLLVGGAEGALPNQHQLTLALRLGQGLERKV